MAYHPPTHNYYDFPAIDEGIHDSPGLPRTASRSTPPPIHGDRGGPEMGRRRKAGGVDTRAAIMREQQFLRNQGYDIAVDGVRGKKTLSAGLDWRTKRHPKRWSEANGSRTVHEPTVVTNRNNHTNQPADSPAVTQRADKGNTPNPGKGIPAGAGGYPSWLPAWRPEKFKPIFADDAIDPAVYARTAMERQYGPILSELMRAEQTTRAGYDRNIAQTKADYGQFVGQIGGRNQEQAALDARMQQESNSVAPELLEAFGLAGADPSVAATIGASADIGADFQRDMAASRASAGGMMQTEAQNEGLRNVSDLQREEMDQLAEIAGQRKDAISERGASMEQMRMDLMREKQDRDLEIARYNQEGSMGARQYNDQTRLARAQFEQDVQQQGFANAMALYNSRVAAAAASGDEDMKGLQLEGQRLQNQYQRKQIAGYGKPKPTGPTGWKKYSDQSPLLDEALGATKLKGDQHRWRVGPNAAWSKVATMLRGRGLNPNAPQGRTFMKRYAALAGIKLGPGGKPVGYLPGFAPRKTVKK